MSLVQQPPNKKNCDWWLGFPWFTTWSNLKDTPRKFWWNMLKLFALGSHFGGFLISSRGKGLPCREKKTKDTKDTVFRVHNEEMPFSEQRCELKIPNLNTKNHLPGGVPFSNWKPIKILIILRKPMDSARVELGMVHGMAFCLPHSTRPCLVEFRNQE